MKTIVTLVDFSDATFKVLKQAHAMGKAFQSHVVLLHVVPQEPVAVGFGLASPTMLREPTEESITEDQTKLAELKESLTKFGIDVSVRQLVESDVNKVLAEVQGLGAELMIMGSHSHGALYNWLVGSTTADILKHARCPVLVVPIEIPVEKK